MTVFQIDVQLQIESTQALAVILMMGRGTNQSDWIFPPYFLCRLQKIHLRKIFLCALFLFLFVPPTAFLCVFCCCCDYCVIPWQDFDSLPRTPPYRPPWISEHYCRDSLGALSRKSEIRFLIEVAQHWGRPHHYQKIPILIIQPDLSHKL